MSDLAKTITEHNGKGVLIAPAGFGKTHLIADALNHQSNRCLVLTHTCAGVNALRTKLRILGVPTSRYRVDTIASWALRLCLSYPQTSGWTIDAPAGQQWRDLYAAGKALLETPFIQKVLSASYEAVYVDEYQDCTASQHELVLALGEVLPLRILGDPLQGIFDFTGEPLVDWDTQIIPEFELLGSLETPWRWKVAGTDDLGTWLKDVREKLEGGQAVSLTDGIPAQVKVHVCDDAEALRNRQVTGCKYFNHADGDSVAGIHKGDNQHKAKCQKLAKNTGGRFSSIEEVEGARLHAFIKKYDGTTSAKDKLLLAIEFAKDKLMSGVANALSAGTSRGETVTVRDNTKNPDLVRSANNYLGMSTPGNLKKFLLALRDAPETSLYARDLFNRLIRVLRNCPEAADYPVGDSAAAFQREFRHTGRPIRCPRIVGTTLLLKGLEFDHCIVLDAGSLSKRDLYVALTRGSKSLTIISDVSELNPAA